MHTMVYSPNIPAALSCSPWCCTHQLSCPSIHLAALSKLLRSTQQGCRQGPRTSVTPAGPCPSSTFNMINMDPVNDTHMSQAHYEQAHANATKK